MLSLVGARRSAMYFRAACRWTWWPACLAHSAWSRRFPAFTLFTSNPFDRLLPGASTAGPESAAAGFGLIFHPPLLYMGYVGFSVAFAFAIAALIGGARCRLGTLVAPLDDGGLVLPDPGHRLGFWWAYYELGWGGWWFWDPVENASFMPWLVGTALIHSLAVTEKRGASRAGRCCWRSRLLAVAARHLPGALRRADLGARLRHRSRARHVHPALAVFVIGSSLLLFAWRGVGRPRRRLRAGVARVACCSATTCCWRSPPRRCCSARSIRCFSMRSAWARFRSGRRISMRCSCR
jgi:cytochrome c biogenesis factor